MEAERDTGLESRQGFIDLFPRHAKLLPRHVREFVQHLDADGAARSKQRFGRNGTLVLLADDVYQDVWVEERLTARLLPRG